MHLKENIKTLRKRKDLTQEQLAQEIGINQKMIQHYEKGRCDPPLETLEKLSDFFGVSIDDMIRKELTILVY